MVFFAVIFIILYEMSFLTLSMTHVIKEKTLALEPVWLWLRDHCTSFSAMTANAVFSDIFTLSTVGVLSEELKSLFVVQQCNQSCCTSCGNQIIHNTSIFVLYITCPNIISTQFSNHVSEAVLLHNRALYCDSCQKYSGDISALQHFVTLPTF